MENDELFQYVIEQDIPETYQPIVNLIGLEAFFKICSYVMGDEIYFPTPETILRKARNRRIIQEYDGHNIKELSNRYNITVRNIQNVLREAYRK